MQFIGGGQPSARFETIEKSLQPFIGNRIMLRFRFDTVNNFENGDLGWFIDDIAIEGSGFKGQQTAVTPLDPPVIAGNVTWYGTFNTTFQLAEGLNRVVAASQQPYPPKRHGPNLVGVDFVNGYLDLTGPDLTLDGIGDIVAVPSQMLAGTVVDINFTSMVITQTYLAGNELREKTVYAITELPADGTFSVPVSLLEGTNTFTATAINGSLNQSEVAFAVDLDTVGPTLSPPPTSYPVGVVSARAGDLVVFQASSTDALGVSRVFITPPDGSTEDMVPSDQIPEAVLDQWRVAGEWVLPMEIPSATPPGSFELAVTAVDNAGNGVSSVVLANVVPTLEAFTFSLLPGQNLISLPLKSNITTIAELLGAELPSAVDSIMCYDASQASVPQEDRWLMFSPDAPISLQTLLNLQTGRGYWLKMKDEAFTFSAPLAPGLPSTPRPILFTYFGQFLEPGTVPPTYPVVRGWNLIGFRSEHPLPVTTGLQSLGSPQRIWASLFEYDNVIRFELDEDPEIILGGFSRVLPTGSTEPGAGFWIFIVSFAVEIAWLESQGVHKWSIQLSRFDEVEGAWVPFPSKRYDEDAGLVYYTAVLSGFSDIAISGSRELPERVFEVSDLVIAPSPAEAGDEIVISATFTNTGQARAVFPATLWIDDTVEAAQSVPIGAGETALVEFGIRRPEGVYKVRVDRLLGDIVVGAAPPPSPKPTMTAVPPSRPSPTPTQEPTATASPRLAPPTPTPTVEPDGHTCPGSGQAWADSRTARGPDPGGGRDRRSIAHTRDGARRGTVWYGHCGFSSRGPGLHYPRWVRNIRALPP